MISTLRGVTLLDTFTVAKQREVTLTLTGRINIWLIELIWPIVGSHNNHNKKKTKISKQFKTLEIWFEITWNLFHLLINSHSTRAKSNWDKINNIIRGSWTWWYYRYMQYLFLLNFNWKVNGVYVGPKIQWVFIHVCI